jgi:DNA-binding MarR family transcriptional regulator
LSSLADATFMQITGQSLLTPRQMGVLITVEHLNRPSFKDVANAMRLDQSTAQELISRMVNHKLLVSRVSENDRRMRELQLSLEGRDLLEKHRHCVDEVQKLLLSRLDAHERDDFLRLLKTLLS